MFRVLVNTLFKVGVRLKIAQILFVFVIKVDTLTYEEKIDFSKVSV